ncbi:hypothetical protein QOT17_017338 [Balamuthia mandrillaris]
MVALEGEAIAWWLFAVGKKFVQKWFQRKVEDVRNRLLRALLVQLLLTVLLVALFASLHAHKFLPSPSSTSSSEEDKVKTAASSASSSSYMWSGAVALLLLLFGIGSSSSSGSSSRSMWSSFAGWTVLLVAYLPYLQQVLLLLEAHRYAQHYHLHSQPPLSPDQSETTKEHANSTDENNNVAFASILFAILLAIKSVPLRLSLQPFLPTSAFLSPASFFIALEVLCRVLLLFLQLNVERFDETGQHAAKLWFLVVLMVWHIHLTFQLNSNRGSMALLAFYLATSSFQDASFDEDWLVDMSLRVIRLLDEAPSIAPTLSLTRWVCLTRCTIPLLLVLLHLSSPSAFLLFASSASTTTTMTMMCWMLMALALLEWKMVSEAKEEHSGRLVLLTGMRVFNHALVRWILDWKVFAGRVFWGGVAWLMNMVGEGGGEGHSPPQRLIYVAGVDEKEDEEEEQKKKRQWQRKQQRRQQPNRGDVKEEEETEKKEASQKAQVSSLEPRRVQKITRQEQYQCRDAQGAGEVVVKKLLFVE